jgi:(4S)-4-hydroxy-5-phosphonooxypentane-2,3-dione isomerase
MSRKALIVEFHCRPGHVEDFVAHASRHAARVKAREPGCLAFDVCIPDEGGTTVFLYEVYDDEEALRVHLETPYLKEFVDGFAPFVIDRTRNVVTIVTA